MAMEIEAKMPLGSESALLETLQRLDARPVGEVLEINAFYDTEQHALKSTDQGLRLRSELDPDRCSEMPPRRIVITHKGPRSRSEVKSRPETELVVHDAEDAHALLTQLGYRLMLKFEKHRRSFRLEDVIVVLDRVPFLGDFVEIEGPSEERVLAIREKLGMGEQPLIQASYASMIASYARDHGLHDRAITFEAAGVPHRGPITQAENASGS